MNKDNITLQDAIGTFIDASYKRTEEIYKKAVKEMAEYLLEKMGNSALSDTELVKAYALQKGVNIE